MFNFNDKNATFKKSQLPFLVLAFAPFFLHDLDTGIFFKVDKNTPIIYPITAQAVIDGKAIKLEVADSPIKQANGLTQRADIEIDRGMLYLTSISQPLIFTGEGMKFSTDLIFIMGDKVVGFYQNIKPCDPAKTCLKYSVDRQYNRVLEVKAGIVEKLGIKNSSQVNISFLIKK